MNPVEISEAIAEVFGQPMDAAEFPYAFLRAFGNKDTTIARLKSGNTNQSDVGGVLQRGNIHLAVAPNGQAEEVLAALRTSPATARYKAKFILATDGIRVEAEELGTGDPLSCSWEEFPDHFGMFLPLAGISTVREIRENAFDIRATAKLNKLYVALLRDNPEWGTAEQRSEMNHFMARLIFSFFAEDTGIMVERGMFSATVSRMSAADSSNTHDVIRTLFTGMNIPHAERGAAGLPRWAIEFPYVNGGLFAGDIEVPLFSRTARAYLLQVGTLDWKQINPDIFGSMIQAVADDEERGSLGMHYTSVPNILKVLNPLFLDNLRAKLEEAGDNPRTLLNLRKRLARIRVFDPACGSGNFLVIAYKEMRKIEHEINRRRGEPERASDIPLTNFRGIELRHFAAEIARLALHIAEFQCDEVYRGQLQAIRDFIPLPAENWITCGNALRLDWLSVCPPTGTGVKLLGDDLFSTPLDQSEIDFANAGGETYICGNPPWVWSNDCSETQKEDIRTVFQGRVRAFGTLDYVTCWFVKATDYVVANHARAAFVATNSIGQGQTVPYLWPHLLTCGIEISFAHTMFTWSNNAMRNATADAVVIGLARRSAEPKFLFTDGIVRACRTISPYLVPDIDVVVQKSQSVLSALPQMYYGCKPIDGGHLILSTEERKALLGECPSMAKFIKRLYGSEELIHNVPRYCLFIDDDDLSEALDCTAVSERVGRVREVRLASSDSGSNNAAGRAHQFREHRSPNTHAIYLPAVSSED